MIIFQKEISFSAKNRGFHLVTDEFLEKVQEIKTIEVGTAHIFLKHTSASLSINENCDRTVRSDMENLFNDLCDDKPYYQHTYEGRDDMPAHIKSSMIGCSLTIPITNGELNLGTWQGIYLGEHRDYGENRKVVVTIMGK